MKPLRDMELQPALYQPGDIVEVERTLIQLEKSKGEGAWKHVHETHKGIVQVAVPSQYNISYDWYTVELENGEIIELWWMTGFQIIKKLESVEQNGLPSQEA